jgi:hypothetical protein
MTSAQRMLGWALVLALGLGLGLRLAIAAREWFIADDFFFLAQVQDAHWSFREALLPTRSRTLAVYRPIGLDGYFLLNFALYGWNAFGYYLSALALQALTALALFRIALHYRLDARVAWTLFPLVLLAAPSTLASYAVAEHNYICAALGYSTCLAALIADLTRPRGWLRWSSYVALVFGLLSNEVCTTLPWVAWVAAFVELRHQARVARLRRACAITWPYFALTGLFVDFKLSGVPTRQDTWFYDVDISSDLLGNLLGNLALVHGGNLLLALVAAAAGLLVVRARRGQAGTFGHARVAALLVFGAWLLATSLPFSVLAVPASRFALLQLPAAALLWAVLLDFAFTYTSPKLQPALLLLALTVLVPWPRMLSLLEAPRGTAFRRAYEVLARDLPASDANCVTVVCNASRHACADFNHGTRGGALWRAVVPNRTLSVEFSDATALDKRASERCLRYYLTTELALTREPPAPVGVQARATPSH